ncbi:hypothetical protein FHS41_008269 [Streptomyces violarus]|uniref:Uncharacterized protein n=1 Tax=Streptomyces violarus TaxID=67380 RepID=A0A7W5A0E1_9ACTN|nr:hypothetical protein [Streptomyces violarus]MBB3081711.1 hypothetical protein [Streptomyces violarus]
MLGIGIGLAYEVGRELAFGLRWDFWYWDRLIEGFWSEFSSGLFLGTLFGIWAGLVGGMGAAGLRYLHLLNRYIPAVALSVAVMRVSEKATSLNGLVDALVRPEDGRWPAAKLTEWGEGAAIALSRYTEGSLQGLFDGQDASLPATDLPILSFDFSRLDRNSPAIPSLMAAVSCWVEHVWLPQSTAVHRHLVLEEAWQILLSPATAELIQRLLKNSRKAGLSLKALMHTLSDLGKDKAQDLARLCEIAHVGRLGPEEAAAVGALLGLPAWAIEQIPTLEPGQAVWKIGPDYVDIIQTVLGEEELALTDTSSRRRKAQHALAAEPGSAATATDPGEDSDEARSSDLSAPVEPGTEGAAKGGWDWELPPNVVDTRDVDIPRHETVLQAALEGRCDEAAQLAAVHEREDISAHGLYSPQALAWLETRAQVADLRGEPGQAAQLRATVARMGKGEWFEQTDDRTTPQWHRAPEPSTPAPPVDDAPPAPKRRRWPYIAAIAALAITIAAVYQTAENDRQSRERQEKAEAYKGRSGAVLRVDGVKADLVAQWNSDRDRVIVELRTFFDRNAKYLRIDASGKSAYSTRTENLRFPKAPEVALPVTDPLADVTVRIAVGGKTWKEGSRADFRTVRLAPTGVAYDAETGEELPSDLSFSH